MKFLIAARPYNHQSFGVVCLHKLRQQLLDLGHDAEIIFLTGDGKNCEWGFSDDPKFYQPNASQIIIKDVKEYLKEVRKEGFIVYPEIVNGNPLGGRNVVRYLLNREGALKPWGMDASNRDFFLVHSIKFRDKFNYALFNVPSINWLDEDSLETFEKRSIDVTYLGKGQKFGFDKIIKNTLEITRQWPNTQQQLRLLLSKTRFFFTFDPLTATSLDAILCGAIPCVFYSDKFDTTSIEDMEIPVFSAYAKLNKNFEVEKIDFNIKSFRETRQEIIEKMRYLESNYADRVAVLASEINSFFVDGRFHTPLTTNFSKIPTKT